MRIVTVGEISALIDAKGILANNILWRDERYVVPSREWMNGEFATLFRKLNFALSSSIYRPGSNDCDKWARRAASFACDLHNATPGAPEAGLAIGEFWYDRAVDGQDHGINHFLIENAPGGDLDFAFWEPQQYGEITLIQQELSICRLFDM